MIKYSLLLTLLTITLYSCKGDDGPPAPKPPVAAQLTFPEQDSECTTGISINDFQTDVTFQWQESENTDRYVLTVENLTSSFATNYNSVTNSFVVTLSKATPYSWYVTSISDALEEETAQSETWQFYNAGDGVTSYPPFPAAAVFPQMGETILPEDIILEWSGADVENDIASYDVFFEAANPPTVQIANGITLETTAITGLVTNTVYYWYVVTTDEAGDTSTSDIFEFRTY